MPKEICRNRNLIRKQREEYARRSADAVLLAAKNRRNAPERHVQSYLRTTNYSKDRGVEAFILEVHNRSDLLEDRAYIEALCAAYLLRAAWLKPVSDWKPASHNTRRQFSSLVRHLFCEYEMPVFMDSAWLDYPPGGREQNWFIHIGTGGNIRKVDNLPLPLTKLQAHHFLQSPDNFNIREAIRWGQVRGMGGSTQLATAIVASRLRSFVTSEQEGFWQSVINYLILHDTMLDRRQVAPLIDYVHHQKFEPLGPVMVNGTFVTMGPPQPGFTMKGRPLDVLMNQMEAWHRKLARIKECRNLQWPSKCGVAGLDRVEGEPGNQKRYVVQELLSSAELKADGAKMHHCVYSYAQSCVNGRVAIFSMKADTGSGLENRLTIEVTPQRQIVQARGKYNAKANQLDLRILRIWATRESLTFGRIL
jgi:hypothetical protein